MKWNVLGKNKRNNNKWQSANSWETEKKWEDQSKSSWGEEQKWGEENKWGSNDKWGSEAQTWGGGSDAPSSGDAWGAQGNSWAGEQGKRDWETASTSWGNDGGAYDMQGKRQRQDEPAQASWPAYPEPAASNPYIDPNPYIAQPAPQLIPSEPRQILQQLAKWPENIANWAEVQDVVWAGHPRLPEGWLRVWSRSQDREYYVRRVDMFNTFDISEVR